MKNIQKLLILVLIVTITFMNTIIAKASDYSMPVTSEEKPYDLLLETITYDDNVSYNVPSSTTKILISKDEIQKMSDSQLKMVLSQKTNMSTKDINILVKQMESQKKLLNNSIYSDTNYSTLFSGLPITITSWDREPYVYLTERWVTYSTSWIGIDAYRSSVPMTKGESEYISIIYALGFSGSGEIKKFKGTLTASCDYTRTTTVSSTDTCPAWTVAMWRPYSTWYKDYYSGVLKHTVYTQVGLELHEYVYFEPVGGEDRRLIYAADEMWSRVNTSEDKYASTPVPPTSAPPIQ